MIRSAAYIALAGGVLLLGLHVTSEPAPAQSLKQKSKSPRPALSIKQGSCCADVNGVCISTCRKPGGCSGKGDCVVKAK